MKKETFYQIVVAGRSYPPFKSHMTVVAVMAELKAVDDKLPVQVFEVCSSDITSEFIKLPIDDQRVEGSRDPDSVE